MSTNLRNRLCEFAQIRGNLTDNADGNPEPRFAEEILKLKYSKSEIAEVVKNSRSKRECLLKMNLTPYGGNYRVLDKYINFYQIDTSHFLGQGWNVNNSPADVKPIEKYFNNEIPITSYKLKNRIIKEMLKPLKCEVCGLEKWNDVDIPLELHHINGNNKDNSFDNLQLLCPNCHALTDNYRNRK